MDSRSARFMLGLLVSGPLCAAAAPPTFAHLPLAFEVNQGQMDARAAYLTRSSGMDVFLTDAGALLSMSQRPRVSDRPASSAPWQPTYLAEFTADALAPSTETWQALALRYGFAGANPHPRIEGVDPLPGHSNYFIGNDPQQWHTDIPTYARVRYGDVYPGIDVVFYGNEGRFEFDVEVAPGADLAQVRLRVEGADALALDARGDLKITTALGELIQHRPVVYQMIAGERHELRGAYALDAQRQEIAFDVPAYDHQLALVVDPVVTSFLIGSSSSDTGSGIAAAASGEWYLTGYTTATSTGFPTTVGAYQTSNAGGTDSFVRKISADTSTLIYSTLLGGNSTDSAKDIAVDANGIAYVTGTTQSSNFPVMNALQGTYSGNISGFVTALNASGSGLVYSTYLGGNNSVFASGIAVDPAGDAFVTGYTTATNLPTSADAFQSATAGQYSAFVFKLDAAGARVYGTYVVDDHLGFGGDHAARVAIDDVGNAYIAGYTNSYFFGGSYNGILPTVIGASGGSYDAFVARLNSTGTYLDYITYIGGSKLDEGTALAVDGSHQAVVGLWSISPDLPPNTGQNMDDWAWFGRLDDTGTQVVAADWLGAAGAEVFPNAVVLLADGRTAAVGDVQNPTALPALNALSIDCGAACGSASDYGGFLATLATNFSKLDVTRVTGGAGSTDTRVSAATTSSYYANSNYGNPYAFYGTSNGTPPGTTKPPGTGNDVYGVLIDPFTNATPLPPVVNKYFEPPSVEINQKAVMKIVISNPNKAIPLTNVFLSDYFPICLTNVANTTKTSGACSGGAGVSGFLSLELNYKYGYIAPAGVCVITLEVRGSGVCTNTTGAPTSDQGTGLPASAVLREKPPVPKATWSGSADSNTSNAANFDTPPTKGGDTAFPSVANTTVTNDLPNLVQNQVSVSGANYVISGNPIGVLGALSSSGANNTISAPIKADAAAVFVGSDPAAASLTVSGGISVPAGGNLILDGAGTKTINSAISGGSGGVDVSGGTVVINTSPTFTGDFYLLSGITTMNVVIHEKTFLDGDSILRGIGPWDSITAYSGVFYPGTGTSPTTVDVGDLTIISRAAFDFSSGNASHSIVNTTGSVVASGMTLQLNFASAPAINTTFSGLINSPGGQITGCPERVLAAQPNLILTPLCTTFSIGAKVTGNDRVFYNGFQW